MRLVMFLQTGSDYYPNLDVLPIEFSDKESAILHLWQLLADSKKLRDDYAKKQAEWHKNQPKKPRTYNGNNSKVLQKQLKLVEAYYSEHNEWTLKHPIAPDYYINFCGHQIYSFDLTEDSVEILTIDEWFEQHNQ